MFDWSTMESMVCSVIYLFLILFLFFLKNYLKTGYDHAARQQELHFGEILRFFKLTFGEFFLTSTEVAFKVETFFSWEAPD